MSSKLPLTLPCVILSTTENTVLKQVSISHRMEHWTLLNIMRGPKSIEIARRAASLCKMMRFCSCGAQNHEQQQTSFFRFKTEAWSWGPIERAPITSCIVVFVRDRILTKSLCNEALFLCFFCCEKDDLFWKLAIDDKILLLA